MISVLLPTTNRRWLREAEASARAQGAEVVIEQDTTRTGQSATVNRAFRKSRGEYVTVLHDDDFYLRDDALALLEATLDAHPEAAAVYSLPRYVDVDGKDIGTPPKLREWMAENPIVMSAAGGMWMHGGGMLYRRRWWEHAGPWDETLPCCEEWEYHLRMLSLGAVFVACPVETVAYRVHDTQKSGRRVPIGRRSLARLKVRQAIRAKYEAVLA